MRSSEVCHLHRIGVTLISLEIGSWPMFNDVLYMPKAKYGQPAFYKDMRAGDSPIWVGHTRYHENTTRLPWVADKNYWTAHGDLFLQTLRHEAFLTTPAHIRSSIGTSKIQIGMHSLKTLHDHRGAKKSKTQAPGIGMHARQVPSVKQALLVKQTH